MRWRITDAKDYLQTKDYIDTAVIPLINIKVGAHFKITAEKGEFTQLLSDELERQLKGRVYLLPLIHMLIEMKKPFKDLRTCGKSLYQNFRMLYCSRLTKIGIVRMR